MAPKTGKDMYLYYNSGTHASPTWVDIDEVGDVSIDGLSRTIAELKRRAKDFTKGLPGLLSLMTVTFTLLHGLNATVFTALIGYFFAGTVKEYAIMDGSITVAGSQGLRSAFLISEFPFNQPLEDVAGHEVKLSGAYWEEPAGTEIDPDWYTYTT